MANEHLQVAQENSLNKCNKLSKKLGSRVKEIIPRWTGGGFLYHIIYWERSEHTIPRAPDYDI